MSGKAKWWETAVFYQIYPRSFMDSNGDGIGDLIGIESKLDHLVRLGVNAVWISPFYPSPMADFGYDISDYCAVHPLFGSLADFDRLLRSAHERGIRIVVDLVINHTSDEHPWFVEARSDKDSPKHDWYIWRPMRRGRFGRQVKPNNWVAQFELSSAWWPNEATGEYYLGTFTRRQPEVNWRNPELRAAMYGVVRFWLDRGVDGFRLDVVNWYVKDAEFRSNPRSLTANPDLFQKHIYDRNRPETHGICRDLRLIADSYEGDRVLIGEIFCRDPEQAASYHGAKADELHMAFNFDLLYRKWSARSFRDSVLRWYSALPEGSWPNLTFSNHDQARHIARYRGRNAEETAARAKVAAALLLTLRGTPFLYYGEELGMSQARLKREDLRDPLGVKTWPLRFLGRDGERTPMQWSTAANAGFTTGTPWLPVNQDFIECNAEDQLRSDSSLFSWYRDLIRIRKFSAALRTGTIEFIDGNDASVIAFERVVEGAGEGGERAERVTVVLNLDSRPHSLKRAVVDSIRGKPVLASTRFAAGTVVAATAGTAPAVTVSAYEVLIVGC